MWENRIGSAGEHDIKALLCYDDNGFASQSHKQRRATKVDSSSLSHTKWNCTYHIVFIPKYRRKIMYGELKTDIREIVKKLCEYKQVQIL